MNKTIIQTEIRVLRKTKVWSSLLQTYFQEIIEAVVSSYGADLDREESCQELWLFVVKLIPKIKLKGNIGSYTYTCCRNYIGDVREAKMKHKYKSLENIPESIAKPYII